MVAPTPHVKDTIQVFRAQRAITPVEDLLQLELGLSVSVQLSHIDDACFWPDDSVHLTLVDTYASQNAYSPHALS